MKKTSSYLGLAASGVFLCATMARGQAASQAGTAFFESKIRPILVTQCYQCHSSQAVKLKGGLSVEYHESLLRGGNTGPAIVPGNPENSLLIKAVRYSDPDLQMPPKGKRLSDAQIADLVTWVRMGAPDPRIIGKGTTVAAWSKDRREHWAFKPINKKEPIPAVQDTNWVANPIDSFILARLEKEGMKPSPPADKRALIRRATYDLTGLPPTPKEVQDFVDDTSGDAYAKVVDRLLASPQYGERWGRYWLDIARYADTKGDIKQGQDVELFPYAWTYRDYVVRSFNEDKPYNQFIIEQLAADKVALKDRRSIAALGFLTLGPRFNDDKNDIYNDRIDVVSKGLLGLTVTCARCHDHKFDPIPQKDYYSLRGIFDSSVEPEVEPMLESPKMTPEYEAYLRQHNTLEQEVNQTEAELKSKRRRMAANMQDKKDLRKDLVQERNQLAKLELTDPGSPACATALVDVIKPHDSPIFIRGVPENRGEMAPRRFLEILSGPSRPNFTIGSGRLELAQAIVSPFNPMTSRVLVNRVWQHHFGEGFVTTPDDLGNQSEPPSHPELLDYLAARFMREGWSIKKLHRLIMLSSTYQQSSENNPRYAQTDPYNRLLWRANIHRLEFEAVRDSILAMGGQLDLSMGGRPVQLDFGEGGFSHRRTIYGLVNRRNLPELYSQFDFANPDITTGKRYETTVPQQALFMMNNPLVVELARKLVNSSGFNIIEGNEGRIKFLYERIYQREPTEVEIKLGLDFIEESPPDEAISADTIQKLKEQRQAQMNPDAGKRKGGRSMTMANLKHITAIGPWVKYAHALLQTNEAIFIN